MVVSIEKSSFFNSSNGDRAYNAADFAAYFGDLVSNGIFYRNANNLKAAPGVGFAVEVAPGSAFINGYRYENTAAMSLQLATADGVNPRIDRVVLRLDSVARSIKLAVVTGVAAKTPAAPALTRNADIYELGVADITIPQAATTVAAANIADIRLNTALCGLVNSLVSAVYE
jgi:hypothetical protein